jgi:hypothetical protein
MVDSKWPDRKKGVTGVGKHAVGDWTDHWNCVLIRTRIGSYLLGVPEDGHGRSREASIAVLFFGQVQYST